MPLRRTKYSGEVAAVNSEISSGLPLQGHHRYPPPASRPELYSTPATKGVPYLFAFLCPILKHSPASDPAQNPYWKRDVRRAYPQLSVVTQNQLSQLLIAHSSAQAFVCFLFFDVEALTDLTMDGFSIEAPSEEGKSDAPSKIPEPSTLSQAITTITSATKVYSEDKLPPAVPTPFKRWEPKRSADAPHDPFAYFPMVLYQ